MAPEEKTAAEALEKQAIDLLLKGEGRPKPSKFLQKRTFSQSLIHTVVDVESNWCIWKSESKCEDFEKR